MAGMKGLEQAGQWAQTVAPMAYTPGAMDVEKMTAAEPQSDLQRFVQADMMRRLMKGRGSAGGGVGKPIQTPVAADYSALLKG